MHINTSWGDNLALQRTLRDYELLLFVKCKLTFECRQGTSNISVPPAGAFGNYTISDHAVENAFRPGAWGKEPTEQHRAQTWYTSEWLDGACLTKRGIFLKSYWVFYWWNLHMHTCEVHGLVSIWFIVSPSARRAIQHSALADLDEGAARGDCNVPSCTWKSLRQILEKTEFMFLLPVLFLSS